MVTPLPFTGGYAIPFWIAFYSWLIPELIGGYKQRARASDVRRDGGSKVALTGGLWIGIFLAISFAWALPIATIMPMRAFLFGLGILLMLAGMALRWYAIRTLAATFGARLTLLSVLVPQWKDLGTGDVFGVTSDVRREARGARAMDRYERG